MECINLIPAELNLHEHEMLPRLLYVGDVPVEASYHGSALLYRLLDGYPADRLRIIEAGTALSQPARRLPGVRYEDLRLPLSRLQTTRLSRWYGATNLITAVARASRTDMAGKCS